MAHHDPSTTSADDSSSAEAGFGNAAHHATSAKPAIDHSMESEFHRLTAIGRQLAGAAGDLLGLARVEAALALRALPKLGAIALLAIPISLLSWISFSVLVAWGAFQFTSNYGIAILAFFLVQVVTLVAFVSLVKKWIQDMKFTYTKNNIAKFAKEFSRGSQSSSESAEQQAGAAARHYSPKS
jgi:uncharacterized membrane protein YqjE